MDMRVRSPLILALTVCLLPALASGEFVWTGNVSNDWSTPGNWDNPSGTPATTVPGQGDSATLPAGQAEIGLSLTGPDAPDLITLNGGGLYNASGTHDVDSPISVTAVSNLGSWSGTLNVTGTVSGASKVVAMASDTAVFSGAGEIVKLNVANSPFTGGWDIDGGAELHANADGALGSGAVNVINGALVIDVNPSAIFPSVVQVQAGGWLRPMPHTACDVSVELNGGTLTDDSEHDTGNGPNVLSGPVALTGDGYYQWVRGGGYGGGLRITGTVSGGGKLYVNGGNADSYLRLNHPGNTNSGGIEVREGRMVLETNTSLGTGTVSVTNTDCTRLYGPYTFLHVHPDETNLYAPGTQPLIEVNGPYCVLDVGYLDDPNDEDVPLDFTLRDGAKLRTDTSYWNGELTGVISIDGYASFETGPWQRDLWIAGTVQDAPGSTGKVLVEFGALEEVDFRHANNTYSGGTEVGCGILMASAEGALGTGSVLVRDGYRYTGSAPAFRNSSMARSSLLPHGGHLICAVAGALNNVPSVVVEADGRIDIRGTETTLVQVGWGGALSEDSGTGSFVYSGAGQNIALSPGAILDDSLEAGDLPSYAEVSALTGGDGVFGVYLGKDSGSFTGDFTFGDDGVDNICRGVAAVLKGNSYDAAVTFAGKATEAVAGGGLRFYSQTAATLTFNSSAELVTSGTTYLTGGGNFSFSASAGGTFTRVDKTGLGTLELNGSGVLDGKAVLIREGFVSMSAADAADGAVITIDPNGSIAGMELDTGLATTGTITVKAGGYARVNADAGVAGAAAVTFEPGSKILLIDADLRGAAGSVGDGNADVVAQSRWKAYLPAGGVYLGNGTRLTFGPSNLGEVIGGTGYLRKEGGGVLMAPGAAQKVAVLAAPGGSTMRLECPVNLGADGKLVVGALGTYTVLNMRGPEGEQGWIEETALSQDGTVRLDNATANPNIIGTIEVAAGVLQIDIAADLGGATEVSIAENAVFDTTGNETLSTVIKGNGKVKTGTLTLSGGGIAPGDSAGIITVDGSLTMNLGSTLDTEIVGSGNVAGTDHDQVNVVGNASIADGGLNVIVGAPSAALDPSLINATVLTASSLTTTFTSVSVSGIQPLNPAVTPADVAGFYDLSGAVQYDGSTSASVVGTGTSWTAHGGDANLDEVVNVLDLGALANNYKTAGPHDWTTADFNLDGAVNVLDLGALANAYRWDGTGGGEPVPEPLSLAVLALGGLALIRRRR